MEEKNTESNLIDFFVTSEKINMCPYFLPQHTFPIRGKKKPIQFLHVYRALVTGYMNWCRVLIISGSSPWKYIRECNILVLSWRIYVHICLTVKICPVAIARVSNFQEEKWSTADGKKGEKSVEKPHTWCWAEESSGGRLEMGGTFTSLWWPSSFPGSLVVDSLSLPLFFLVVCTWERGRQRALKVPSPFFSLLPAQWTLSSDSETLRHCPSVKQSSSSVEDGTGQVMAGYTLVKQLC